MTSTPSTARGGGPNPGDRVGRFQVLRRIGAGGMGVVYQAYDPELRRHVALKILDSAASVGEASSDRLLREARATSQLDHPRIATVFDVGRTEDGRLFMAMAYYPGQTLAERIAEGPVPPAEATAIAEQIAEALAAAHDAGIVHRDINPANIMLLPDGNVRVLDFGVAHLVSTAVTRPGVPVGTVAYMSPEQTRGQPPDGRSDLWALGVVLYEMLTGSPPFRGDTDIVLIHKIRQNPPGGSLDEESLAEVPPPLAAVVKRCLERDPARRYPDAGAVLAALGGTAAAPEGHVRTPGKKGLLALGIAGALAVAILVPFLGGGDPVPPSASVLAILPFSPAVEDTAALRLGRGLAVTMAINLDGLGGIRVMDPLTVKAQPDLSDPGRPLEERIRAARELGATGVVTGTLVRVEDRIRVDASLNAEVAGEPLARATATVPEGDLIPLTDSLSWGLLRQIWQVRDPPTPSIAGVTTRSFESLREFLRGEELIARGRFREAPEAFSRAVEADSTFWLAYWRLWWTRDWYGEGQVDPEVRETVLAHLSDLPPRDSALASASMMATAGSAYRAYRTTAERHPDDWLSWFRYQDLLVHNGGYLGHGLQESRDALERVVRLNPDLVKGWDHLFWVAVRQRDTIRLRQSVRRLDALAYDSISLLEGGFDELQFFRIQVRMLENGGPLTDEDLRTALAIMTGPQGTTPGPRVFSHLLGEGYSEAQVQLADGLLSRPASLTVRTNALFAKALALAARGRWRDALAAADRLEQLAPTPESALTGLRLAAVGAVLGASDPRMVEDWVHRIESYPPRERQEWAAEVSWLRGLGAAAEGDGPRISASESTLESEKGPAASALLRSLRGIRLAVVGDTLAAADTLKALAAESSQTWLYRELPDHPYLDGLVRLLAGRWYREMGDPRAAAPLLVWYESILPDDDATWMVVRANRILEPLAQLERSRLEEALGRGERSRWHLSRALEDLERPDEALQALVDEARHAVGEAPPQI